MLDTQKIIITALAMLGMLAVIGLAVGLVLRHHIGGFIRTVEREAREQAEAEEAFQVDKKSTETGEGRGQNAAADSGTREHS